jgi:hypothetical protein
MGNELPSGEIVDVYMDEDKLDRPNASLNGVYLFELEIAYYRSINRLWFILLSVILCSIIGLSVIT